MATNVAVLEIQALCIWKSIGREGRGGYQQRRYSCVTIKQCRFVIVLSTHLGTSAPSDNEAMLEGIPGQLGIVLQVHFVQNSRPICADRRHAQVDTLRDIADGLS